MASEVYRIESWVSSRLVGDAGPGGLNTLVGGRIFAYLAPQTWNNLPITYPLVIYNHQSGRDVQALGTKRVMTRPLYQVKVISKGAPNDAARAAADRIDVLMTVAASIKEGYVFTGRRESPIAYQEPGVTPDVNFRHVGGLYRVEAYPV